MRQMPFNMWAGPSFRKEANFNDVAQGVATPIRRLRALEMTDVNRSLSRRIVTLICSVPSFAPPIANGTLVTVGLAFLIVRRFAAMRAEGLTPTLESIALWAGVFALMAISSAAFLLVKRMAPAMVARWRLLAIAPAIVLVSIAVAEIVALAALGKSAALGMLHGTFFSLKIAASFLAGVILLGAAFWQQINDATHSLLLAIALALAILAACAVAGIVATKLPMWLLYALGVAVAGAGCWGAWHNRKTAYALTALLAVIMSFILLGDLQDKGALFWWVFGAVVAAWATTYLRDVESDSDPSWTAAILQYVSWIAVTAAEAYRFLLD